FPRGRLSHRRCPKPRPCWRSPSCWQTGHKRDHLDRPFDRVLTVSRASVSRKLVNERSFVMWFLSLPSQRERLAATRALATARWTVDASGKRCFQLSRSSAVVISGAEDFDCLTIWDVRAL